MMVSITIFFYHLIIPVCNIFFDGIASKKTKKSNLKISRDEPFSHVSLLEASNELTEALTWNSLNDTGA